MERKNGMIKNYNNFLEQLNETKVHKIERSELKIGDSVMTNGEFDKVNLDYKVGKIISMGEYGNILIEFNESFDKNLHSGHKDRGKKEHCFYVPLSNITSNDPEEFEKIIKKVEDEKKNKGIRLKQEYKLGDVIVGIGKYKYGNYHGNVGTIHKEGLDIDGQVGVVYYSIGNDKEPNNKVYWVGFLDKFDKALNHDQEGIPKNSAGYYVDKLHMRPIEPDEITKEIKTKVDKVKIEIASFGDVYDLDDVVIVNGNYNGIKFNNDVGIIREVIGGGGYGVGRLVKNKSYTVQFIKRYNENLYDVNQIIGKPTGYCIPQNYIRIAKESEIEGVKNEIDILKKDIALFNYDYKIGDYVVTTSNGQNFGMDIDGQIGTIYRIAGNKPRDSFYIEFLVNFSPYLRTDGHHINTYTFYRANLNRVEGGKAEEIKKKIENKEILPFYASKTMMILLNRSDIKIKTAFSNLSYFDITDDKNDTITYIPLDKYKRLEAKEDPYKSRFRQQMKIGKFLRIINDKLTDKEVESMINSFKASYDICVKGLADKLKLVSGEDVRYWYNGENYTKGGGSLNGSCMQGSEKGREMQMFVDNPDTIQMLTLIDDGTKKLLGRALVWRLVKPSGGTFMDYIYVRHESDRELFKLYAEKQGWLSGELRNYGTGGLICALNNKKQYAMGVSALDHFDCFRLYPDNMLSNTSIPRDFKNPYWESGEAKVKTVIPEIKFKKGDKVIYKRAKSVNDNKVGTFYSSREKDGKYLIVFEDGKKFAANPTYVHPEKKEI